MSKTEKMSNTRKLNDMGQYVVSMANMLGSMLQKTEKATDKLREETEKSAKKIEEYGGILNKDVSLFSRRQRNLNECMYWSLGLTGVIVLLFVFFILENNQTKSLIKNHIAVVEQLIGENQDAKKWNDMQDKIANLSQYKREQVNKILFSD